MNRIFRCLVLTLSLCLVLASSVLAGELEDKLIEAAKSGDVGTVRALLDKGVDVNTRDTYGIPVLGCAAYKGQLDIVRLLIDRGADVNAKGGYDSIPVLQQAICSAGNPDIVRLLIEKGADVNATTNKGSTALSYAEYQKKFVSNFADSETIKKWDEYIRILKAAGAR